MKTNQAQCLCGSVSLQVEHNSELHACHCGKCRTWGGGAASTLTARSPEISGSEHIGRYSASEWAERCFCKQCGTHLFVQVGEDYYINAGLFADNAGFKLGSQIFIDCKAPYYELANDTPKLTESEFLAMVSGAEK